MDLLDISPTCPRCGHTSFFREMGRINRSGMAITFFQPGNWWSLLGVYLLITTLAAVVVVGMSDSTSTSILILFPIGWVIGLFLWWRQWRRTWMAVVYTCRTCQLRVGLLPNEPWPTTLATVRPFQPTNQRTVKMPRER